MEHFVHDTAPLILSVAGGALLGAWIVTALRPDRAVEHALVRFGTLLSLLAVHWLVLLGVLQGQAPVLTPGQVLVLIGTMIWSASSLSQRIARQHRLTIAPLVVFVVLLAAGASLGLRATGPVPAVLLKAGSGLHITLSVLGISLLLGSGVFAAVRLAVRNEARPGLPAPIELDRLRRRTLFFGWLVISASLTLALVRLYAGDSTGAVIRSHLHPMLTLWVLVTLLAAADRFRWLGRSRLPALASVAFAGFMAVMLVVSLLEFFLGRFA